jgi:hypothetical protein
MTCLVSEHFHQRRAARALIQKCLLQLDEIGKFRAEVWLENLGLGMPRETVG